MSLNGSFLLWHPVTSGVPQGSILGRLLFILYVNDISKSISCKLKIFADDITIYHQVLSMLDCHFLQQNLNSCLQWCSRWQINLNPAKCEGMCISNKRSLLNFLHTTMYGSAHIKWKQSVKYLDANMSMPKPLRFLTFCGISFMVALNLQSVRVSAH